VTPVMAQAMTVGAFVQGMNTMIAQLEASARALLEQGNNALAQQQMLLAGILRGTVSQVSAAYVDSMGATAKEVGVAEQNLFNDLLASVGEIDKVRESAGQDVRASMYKAQSASNQILNRLPLV